MKVRRKLLLKLALLSVSIHAPMKVRLIFLKNNIIRILFQFTHP